MNAVLTNTNVKLLADPAPIALLCRGARVADEVHDERTEFEAIEAIHGRAETMTSLLRDILEFHPSTHWGINE